MNVKVTQKKYAIDKDLVYKHVSKILDILNVVCSSSVMCCWLLVVDVPIWRRSYNMLRFNDEKALSGRQREEQEYRCASIFVDRGSANSSVYLSTNFSWWQFSSPGVVSSIHLDKMFLGKIYVCPAYVFRQMEYDKYEFEVCLLTAMLKKYTIYVCQIGELDTSEDDGVSLAMATTFSVQDRIPLLLVHSIVHLAG